MKELQKPVLSIIAAIGQNNALGKDNKLLWHIPEDFRWFKSHTIGHPVIMGRKTFESIGKSLPKRTNIVITSNSAFHASECLIARSLQEGIDRAAELDSEEIFIIGGASIYKQALALSQRLYLTIVHKEYEADSFFPDYSMYSQEKLKKDSSHKGIKITFQILEKPRS